MSPARQKATDAQILSAYAETGSVWKTGERLGMGGQATHERLVKLRANKTVRGFQPREVARLRLEYEQNANAGTLDALALDMGRTKQFLCRQAGKIGLTKRNRARPYNSVWKNISHADAEKVWTKFKRSKLNLGQFCKANAIDDLGFSRKMQELFADEYEHVIELKAAKQGWYRLGRQFEYRVRDDLKRRGYFVTRSPGSKSPIDLVAIRTGEVVFVQCKRSKQLGVAEWNELLALAFSVGAVPVLAGMAAGARGIEYGRLLAPKDGDRKRRQPMAPWGLS